MHKAHDLGLAGATVWRGIEGYGAASRIHTAKILRLSEDLPLVIEIVDTEENIRAALPEFDALMELAAVAAWSRSRRPRSSSTRMVAAERSVEELSWTGSDQGA